VDDRDLELRNLTYGLVVRLGRVPSAEEAAAAARMPRDELVGAWRRLHEQHAIVLDAGSEEIRMANPFSGVPTAHRVHARGQWWYANCAWDAFGICAALDSPGRIESSCPDCAEPIDVEVRDLRPDDETLRFHCLVPASRWWHDIVFT
jgi:hypothetical protein